jgi:hypothetical protein
VFLLYLHRYPSDRVRSFDCILEAPTVAIVIVKPHWVGFVTLVRVVFLYCLLQSNYITYFPVPPTAAVFTRAIRGVCVNGVSVGIVVGSSRDICYTISLGSFAVAKAVFTTLPASISA